jgi:hypothetical protein
LASVERRQGDRQALGQFTREPERRPDCIKKRTFVFAGAADISV